MKKEQQFWEWFQQNQNSIFHFEENQQEIFDELSAELKKVHSDLVFEISSIFDEKREFVISADGIVEAFPFVESLYSNSPDLKKWKITKFRPRIEPNFSISIADKQISVDDLMFKLEQDEDKIGVMIFFKDYEEELEENHFYRQIAYLFLDSILGEYDVETKVSFIEIYPNESNWNVGKKPFNQLPEIFDKKYQALFN